ncbi:2-C-methyl-D-erythritol 4-phosphate cytidylyltransferase [Salimicrobium sp. PL1-032A]|uniref:2-C-methyl-D-erythritol 4-phosphate cytidylyltransferase n=1 Tax=Salimicrobium sp. PL1-032A TaxID=3095364 RepID=UPI003260677E
MTNYTVVIVAAGQGKRMNAGRNKQFLMIGERPLVVHTLQAFTKDEACREIILVTNQSDEEDMQELITHYKLPKIKMVHGGKERQDSVYQGLLAVSYPRLPVLIHDGARPFIKKENVHQLVKKIVEEEAAY